MGEIFCGEFQRELGNSTKMILPIHCKIWFVCNVENLRAPPPQKKKKTVHEPGQDELTHWGRVTHICVNDLTSIGSDTNQNQCWIIVNKTLRNKLQWNFNRNSNIFIQENVYESVVCKKAAILSRPQWVNTSGVEAGNTMYFILSVMRRGFNYLCHSSNEVMIANENEYLCFLKTIQYIKG